MTSFTGHRTRRRIRTAGIALAACVPTLLAAQASAEVVDSEVGGPITVVEQGAAQPYPSFVKVEGADGEIVDVDVMLRTTHTKPHDLDIRIESPEGDDSVLISDACGNGPFASTDLVFDQDAADPLPVVGPCPDGGVYRPANYVPTPDPVLGTPVADLDRLNGGDPNGIWNLFVYDDISPDSGTIASWSLRVTTTRSEIVVPSAGTIGTADPYPSTKTFEAPPGQVIDDVDLVVNDFNHLHPDDVDMLLQGPGGAATMLMSDACEFEDVHDRTWEFDDEAPAPLSDVSAATCGAGPVRPSSLGAEDILAAPALGPPHGTQLSAYDGLDGGDWTLFVQDDSAGDTGFIGGWSAELTTRAAATTGFTDGFEEAVEGSSASLTVSRSGPAALGPARIDVGLVPGSAGVADVGAMPATLEFARGDASKTVQIPIADDTRAEPAAETIEVALSSPQNDALLAGASSATVSIPASDRNDFTVGKAKRRRGGSVELSVKVPGPGELRAAGKKVEPARASAKASGEVVLLVDPSKKAKKKLKKGRKVKAKIEITFTPTGGEAATRTADVVLKPKRRS